MSPRCSQSLPPVALHRGPVVIASICILYILLRAFRLTGHGESLVTRLHLCSRPSRLHKCHILLILLAKSHRCSDASGACCMRLQFQDSVSCVAWSVCSAKILNATIECHGCLGHFTCTFVQKSPLPSILHGESAAVRCLQSCPVLQALAALHGVPKMPLDNLWRASDIADATPGAVQALLHDLRHADARSH